MKWSSISFFEARSPRPRSERIQPEAGAPISNAQVCPRLLGNGECPHLIAANYLVGDGAELHLGQRQVELAFRAQRQRLVDLRHVRARLGEALEGHADGLPFPGRDASERL